MPGDAAGLRPSNSCHFSAWLNMLRSVARCRLTLAFDRPVSISRRRRAATSSCVISSRAFLPRNGRMRSRRYASMWWALRSGDGLPDTRFFAAGELDQRVEDELALLRIDRIDHAERRRHGSLDVGVLAAGELAQRVEH